MAKSVCSDGRFATFANTKSVETFATFENGSFAFVQKTAWHVYSSFTMKLNFKLSSMNI